jgi:hypothetical protein
MLHGLEPQITMYKNAQVFISMPPVRQYGLPSATATQRISRAEFM